MTELLDEAKLMFRRVPVVSYPNPFVTRRFLPYISIRVKVRYLGLGLLMLVLGGVTVTVQG